MYNRVPKIMIICYTVPEIRCVTDVIIYHFGLFFALLPPARKIKIKKIEKKHLEVSSFYTSVPKFTIICYTVPEIWRMTDVIVTFHFGSFFALLRPNSPKNQNLKKMKKTPGDIIILHTPKTCTYTIYVYQKL